MEIENFGKVYRAKISNKRREWAELKKEMDLDIGRKDMWKEDIIDVYEDFNFNQDNDDF